MYLCYKVDVLTFTRSERHFHEKCAEFAEICGIGNWKVGSSNGASFFVGKERLRLYSVLFYLRWFGVEVDDGRHIFLSDLRARHVVIDNEYREAFNICIARLPCKSKTKVKGTSSVYIWMPLFMSPLQARLVSRACVYS